MCQEIEELRLEKSEPSHKGNLEKSCGHWEALKYFNQEKSILKKIISRVMWGIDRREKTLRVRVLLQLHLRTKRQ